MRGERALVRKPSAGPHCLLLLAMMWFSVPTSSSSVTAQETNPVPQTRWERSTGQPPMTVFGAVYSTESGLPVEGAAVILGDTREGAVTDSLGRFGFRASSSGSFPLRVLRIGYEELILPIEVETTGAVAVELGIEPTHIPLCPLVVCAAPFGCDAVEVWVRDVLTGIAPIGPITLRVSNPGATDSVTVRSVSDSTELHIGLVFQHQFGPFTAEVSAPGYATWQSPLMDDDECGKLGRKRFRLWLFPRGDSRHFSDKNTSYDANRVGHGP